MSYSTKPSRAPSPYSSKSSKPSWQTQSSTVRSLIYSNAYLIKSFANLFLFERIRQGPSHPGSSNPSKPYGSKSYKPSSSSSSPDASRIPSYSSKSYKPSSTTREPSYGSKSYKPSFTTKSSLQPNKAPTPGSSSRQPSLSSKSYKPTTNVRSICSSPLYITR
jgi:hypothetical protein